MQASPPAAPADRAPIAILGVPFDNVTTEKTLEVIGEMIASGQPHYGATANVDFIVQALDDVELRRILFDAHLVLADGMPIVWASKFLGNPLPERVTGSGMIPQLLARAEQKGWKVFFLGGTEQSVATAAEKTRAKHPKLKLVGVYSPPFKPLLEMDHADILRRLHETKPDIVLVAFGCPKQEKWINMNYRAAGVPFMVGVGATIDFLAGTFKRAPEWMQKSGTEWIFRMLQEPRRLAGRYGNGLRVFTFAILWQWWRLRARKVSLPPDGPAAVEPDPFGNFIIRAPVRLCVAESQAYGGEWRRAVENGTVMFDLAGTSFADSTGLGVLIRLRKRARELGHQFFLVAPRPSLAAALRLMKLDEFFTVQASVAGAHILLESLARSPVVTSGLQAAELQIRWSGEVTALNSVELGVHTESELSQTSSGMAVVIDLSRVTFVDSTGIGLMLRFKKNLKRRDINLKFTNATAPVRNVFHHTRLEEYLLDEGK
jgi:N-acetylglucosaminyldiphosphoundecaprenol N-acetyl-beta-D-mannosaminyltransferase